MKPCSHFPSCGGCKHQDVPYATQLATKQRKVEELFGPALPIIPSAPTRFRSKMEFSFGGNRDILLLGLHKKRGQIEDLSECTVCPEWFQEALNATRTWAQENRLTSYFPPKNRGHLRTLTLRQMGQARVAILTVAEAVPSTWNLPGIHCIVVHQVLQKGRPTEFRFDKTLIDMGRFKASPLAFLQPNITIDLHVEALKLAKIQPHERVFDLCCGVGILSVLAAAQAREVIGIELQPEAVEAAKANALPNTHFLCADMALLPAGPCDVLFIDPPRSGLSPQAIEAILKLKPGRIIYISCNPETQKRDIALLGRTVAVVQPIDQFPHTDHLENICVLM